jgi:RNA polymerase sigma-70 factor (ECF subfamily)
MSDTRPSLDFRTHPSLIESVRDPSNHEAWERFMERYRPMVRRWCGRWCHPADADDLAHEVFVELLERMRTFQYDPTKGRFRGWLKTVTHRLMAGLKRKGELHFVDDDILDEQAAEEELAKRLEVEFDLELLEQAKASVRGRVERKTWTAYVETAEQGRKPAEVAGTLGMKVGAVYQAKHAVTQALRSEIDAAERRYDSEVRP